MTSVFVSIALSLVVPLLILGVIGVAIAVGRSKPGQSGAALPESSSTTPIAPPEPPPARAEAKAAAVPPPAAPKAPAAPLPPVEGDDTEEVTFETLMVSSVVPRLRETSALGSANRVIDLKAPVITIGRAKDNDIVLKEEAASGKHCRLEKHGLSYRLVDLNSTNKTWVNGAEKQNVVLRNSDQIKIGNTTFVFELFGDRG